MKHLLSAVFWGSLYVITYPFAKIYDLIEIARKKLRSEYKR